MLVGLEFFFRTMATNALKQISCAHISQRRVARAKREPNSSAAAIVVVTIAITTTMELAVWHLIHDALFVSNNNESWLHFH